MPLNIPMPQLPLSGLNQAIATGGNLFQQMINPALQRENMMRQYKEHQENKRQLEEHFQAQLGLSKAAASRAAQAAADAHRLAMNKLDPTFQARQYEALENYYKNKLNQNGAQNNEQMPSEVIPTQEEGQGLGVFSPEGLQEAQQPKQVQQPSNMASSNLSGAHLDLMRQFPALRGFFKKTYGFDPLSGESNVLHGVARDASDLEKLKKNAGEDSEVYQNAKAAYDANIEAKKDLRDLRERTKQGLKSGEKLFYDESTGEPLGKEIPLTAKERESEEGNILFNELYPAVYKGAASFSGEGSIARLDKAFANYKSDPKARQLVDDLLLSDKAMAATVVNEASTLKSGHTNQTYNRLRESLEAQDIPKLIKKLYKQYKLPPSAQLQAAMRYQKLLSDARKKARTSAPATQKLYFNPEMQVQHESEMNEGLPNNKKNKNVIVIDPNGNKFETTEENAKHLPKGWSRG